jgi:hypothetical protein
MYQTNKSNCELVQLSLRLEAAISREHHHFARARLRGNSGQIGGFPPPERANKADPATGSTIDIFPSG